MIDTITFDLWNTLIHDTRANGGKRTSSRLTSITEVLTSVGMRISLEDLKRGYFQCLENCVAIRKTGYDVSFQEQIKDFLECSKKGMHSKLTEATVSKIESIYADVYLEFPSIIHPEAFNILETLRTKNIKLAIVSNTSMTPGRTFRQFLFKHGLAQHFDALVFSDELQISKPNTLIFQHTLSKLSARADRTIHVGDQYQTDIKGAINTGMHSILIDPDPNPGDWDSGTPSYTFNSLASLLTELPKVTGDS